MNTTISCIKSLLMATLPSFILGGVLYGFLALCQGAEGLKTVDGIWYFLSFVLFLYLLATKNDGRQIFARSLRYFSYELWATPLFFFIYFAVTGGQLSPQDKALGQAIGTLAALFMTTGVAIVTGLLGLVCHMISKNLLKSDKKKNRGLAKDPVIE